MNKILSIFCIIFTFVLISTLFPDDLPAQEAPVQIPVVPDSLPRENTEASEKSNQFDNSKKINLDMQVLYGIQYNQLFSAFNLSQQSDTSVYLLSTNFNRSGDFGYDRESYVNSGFYENKIGLTVNWNWTDVKLIIDGEADNDSRGMFDNEVYSKEEKGKNKIAVKTIYKFSPSTEINCSIGGAWYKHSLVALDPDEHLKSRLLQGNFKVGLESVWSSSNRLRFYAGILYYDYTPQEVENDKHIKSEIFNDFSVTRNLGFSIGVGYIRNKDYKDMDLPVPVTLIPVTVSLSIKGFKNFSSSFSYKYDLVPFQPEEFYLEKYINPNYALPPGKIHNGEASADLKINSVMKIRGSFEVEKDDNFYNYYTIYGNVLSANTVEVLSYRPGLELNIALFENIIELALGFDYYYFDAVENITYQPDYTSTSSLKYNGKKWKFEWSNLVRGKVYTDPNNDYKIQEAVIGSLGVQRIVLEGSYFYGKIENLYNTRYTLRKDYPEPGISFLAGLRILI